MNEAYAVYMHIAPNGKKYIGMTGQPVYLRWRDGKGYKNNPYFWRAIVKETWDKFTHTVLLSGLSQSEAEQKEIDLIKKYQTHNKKYGYNLEYGGHSQGRVSDETKLKMSISSTGKKHTEETKLKISVGVKGLVRSEETRKRMSIAQSGAGNAQHGKIAYNAKKITQLNISNEVMGYFNSSYEAEKTTGISGRSIRSACSGSQQSAGGYGWRYA